MLKKPLLFKLITIIILIVVLYIPLIFTQDLIFERQGYKQATMNDIANSSYYEQKRGLYEVPFKLCVSVIYKGVLDLLDLTR